MKFRSVALALSCLSVSCLPGSAADVKVLAGDPNTVSRTVTYHFRACSRRKRAARRKLYSRSTYESSISGMEAVRAAFCNSRSKVASGAPL